MSNPTVTVQINVIRPDLTEYTLVYPTKIPLSNLWERLDLGADIHWSETDLDGEKFHKGVVQKHHFESPYKLFLVKILQEF